MKKIRPVSTQCLLKYKYRGQHYFKAAEKYQPEHKWLIQITLVAWVRTNFKPLRWLPPIWDRFRSYYFSSVRYRKWIPPKLVPLPPFQSTNQSPVTKELIGASEAMVNQSGAVHSEPMTKLQRFHRLSSAIYRSIHGRLPEQVWKECLLTLRSTETNSQPNSPEGPAQCISLQENIS